MNLIILLASTTMTFSTFMADFGYEASYVESFHIEHPADTSVPIDYHLMKVLLLTEYYLENIDDVTFHYVHYYYKQDVINITRRWMVEFMNADDDRQYEMIKSILKQIRNSQPEGQKKK